MGIVSDREDVNSMALSVFDKLVQEYNLDLRNIGRLEVGTETLVDKSKSVKTYVNLILTRFGLDQLFRYVMSRFEEVENFDVCGVDNKNACYGGTQALFK